MLITETHDHQNQQLLAADRILRSIVKLCQASVVFTSFDDLFRNWLQYVDQLHVEKEVSIRIQVTFAYAITLFLAYYVTIPSI